MRDQEKPCLDVKGIHKMPDPATADHTQSSVCPVTVSLFIVRQRLGKIKSITVTCDFCLQRRIQGEYKACVRASNLQFLCLSHHLHHLLTRTMATSSSAEAPPPNMAPPTYLSSAHCNHPQTPASSLSTLSRLIFRHCLTRHANPPTHGL